eukprot:3777168-Lingulodinium_polyedra.AAC.1
MAAVCGRPKPASMLWSLANTTRSHRTPVARSTSSSLCTAVPGRSTAATSVGSPSSPSCWRAWET